MPSSPQTIDHATLRRLLEEGASLNAEAVSADGGWIVMIRRGRSSRALTATRGQLRSFRQFETLAGYLKELGIVHYRVDATGFEARRPGAIGDDVRSSAASTRMKRTHEAAAYDAWFRDQVQASIDDPRTSIDHEAARAFLAERRELLMKRAGAKGRP